MRSIFRGFIDCLLVAAACGVEAERPATARQPPAVALALAGEPPLPIVVGKNASERTRAAAATLVTTSRGSPGPSFT